MSEDPQDSRDADGDRPRGARKGKKEDGGAEEGRGGRGGGRGGGNRNQKQGGRSSGGGSYANGGGYGSYAGTTTYGGSYGGYGLDETAWWEAVVPKAVIPSVWTEYMAPDGTPYYYNCHTGLTQWEKPPELNQPPPEPVQQPRQRADERQNQGQDGGRGGGGRGDRGGDRGDRDGGGGGGGDRGGDSGNRPRSKKKGAGGGGAGGGGGGGANSEGPSYGPPGCNLFAFHLPDDWSDSDLYEHFVPHGKVISAKVMKEVGTGRSRGFGFVSYEDRNAAATAVKKMQGYKILGKRLKVEFKKGEQSSAKFEEKVTEALGEAEPEVEAKPKKHYPDDERLIGYLKAVSARNTMQTLKESGSWADGKDGVDAAGSQDAPLAEGSLAALLTSASQDGES